jgi:hypothetical protein
VSICAFSASSASAPAAVDRPLEPMAIANASVFALNTFLDSISRSSPVSCR